MNYLTSYKSNKNIIYSCKYHIIWCTKFRRDLLKEQVDIDLKNIILEISKKLKVEVIEVEILPDHVHLLVDVDPQFGVHKYIKNVKGASSKLLRDKSVSFFSISLKLAIDILLISFFVSFSVISASDSIFENKSN